MSKIISVDQITQLRELERARMRAQGVGYADEFQAFLGQLRSGGVSPGTTKEGGERRTRKGPKLPDRDPRILQQAKVLWDKGWGRELGIDSYVKYLENIPDLPQFPETWDVRFPHLVLVDRRIRVVETCRLLGVYFSGGNATFVPHDAGRSATAPVYWMRCQDGKAYRRRKPDDCRAEFAARGDEVGCEAHEGLALYAQSPDFLEVNTAGDLPGSVHSGGRGSCAYLGRWAGGGVELCWRGDDSAGPDYGSLSRGEYKA